MTAAKELLRKIPKVDLLLDQGCFGGLLATFPRQRVVHELRHTLDELRRAAIAAELAEEDVVDEAIALRVEERLRQADLPSYRRVINATGVILHTGLGRATLPEEVAATLGRLAVRPQRVEIELETGQRGGRDAGCVALLTELIGCEAATVVNNNAAATLLMLAALGRGKKVILSRGELVEIGGSFRVPEILEESGCELVEVGTTNRTHPEDYRRAIDDQTGILLKVHTSNYRIVGFTQEVDLPTLVALGREHGVPAVHDLGSGCLIDLAAHGRPGEDLVQASVAAGADLVSFSGDKLLGGPQAGILVGKRDAIEKCRRHPLFRAFRPGRLIYTALEAVLRIYRDGEAEALERIPALRQLTADLGELEERARTLAEQLSALPGFEVRVVECRSQAGSGSLPARDYPSWGVEVSLVNGDVSEGELARTLRLGDPSVLTLMRDERLLFDVRTLNEEELALVERRLRQACGSEQPARRRGGARRQRADSPAAAAEARQVAGTGVVD